MTSLSLPKVIVVISDSTGETAMTMLRAVLVQYPDSEGYRIIRHKNVRSADMISRLIDSDSDPNRLIVFTVASQVLRSLILEVCSKRALLYIDLLGPMLQTVGAFLGKSSGEGRVGALRTVDEDYFRRIASVEYTVKHDDGKCLDDLDQADIVLLGISRTSKTPLSIFLSHKGYKVVNIPIVMSSPLPREIFEIDQRKIVALTIDEDSLRRIRKKRLEGFGQDPNGDYASVRQILSELQYAEDLFKKNRRWPIINVTDRSLEETSAEILRIINSRMGQPPGSLI